MDTPLRCFCSHKPLLGVVRRDNEGQPYVHIKTYKQGRIFGEYVIPKGQVYLKCRDCGRWHLIKIETINVDFSERPLPAGYEVI